jgi:septal ring factor EnvC (AmiA/AmiB activator)
MSRPITAPGRWQTTQWLDRHPRLRRRALPQPAPTRAAHRALDNLLNQLREAQNSQTDAQNRVADLTQQVNADNALIKQVNALLIQGQNDARILNQDIAGLTSAVNLLLKEGFGAAADRLINRARVIILSAVDGPAEEINEDLANTVFQRAAAADGEESAAAASLDLVSANLVEFLGFTAVAGMYFEVGRLSAEAAALGVVLAQLSPLQDQYHQAEDQIGKLGSRLAAATEELNADNADVSTLSNEVDAAQEADKAALNAMTSACEATQAG